MPVDGCVAAAEGVVVREGEDRGVQDAALLGVEDLQSQAVVFAEADGAGETDPQAQRGAWGGGGVVGVTDDGALGEVELLGEELLGVQGHGAPFAVWGGT
ncbi:hypothetical protein AQI95_29050 [Streptomyces yokosukanensis]|uniref:Uncharacterized protein n=1 Tax=Streptomyces yokosukanensis TaxID=67386 RepID=A0A101NZQ9_9ACTN|nr:hypothetical protein [Streptomyces yokosukanensis]KUN02123.1 hypothetical protein AQI95_29050 [Streptomyces yokosukanensis]